MIDDLTVEQRSSSFHTTCRREPFHLGEDMMGALRAKVRVQQLVQQARHPPLLQVRHQYIRERWRTLEFGKSVRRE